MDITIRKGVSDDLENFLTFTHEVRDAMPDTAWFALDPDEELRELTADGSMEFWLAEAEGRLAAVFSIIRPGLRDFNIGFELGLTKEDLLRVTHMDTAAVHPDFRGRGLQRKMMGEAEKALKGCILLCTIHPDNRFSLGNGATASKEKWPGTAPSVTSCAKIHDNTPGSIHEPGIMFG